MRLRTRVLSFMLAGSMMLSATPVSAFAETPVLGGTVSPTALSETNSTGTLAFDQYGYPYDSTKGNEYETNHHTTAVVSSDGSWAYQKFTNSQGDVYILVLAATFSQDLTGQIINCQVISNAPTLTGGTYNGIVQLGSTNQKSDASGCTFNAPIAVLAAGTTLTRCTANSSVQCAAADITLTGCTINRKSDDSTVLWLSKYDDSNTAAGCSMTLNNCNVSCGVLVSADGKATIKGGTYNIPGEKMGIVANGTVHITGGEFTTQIVASTNGSITIESGTFNLGEKKFISAAGGDITIEDGTFDSYLQAQTGSLTIKGGTFTGLVGALNGNITIENGTFTGQTLALSANDPKYTGVLNITGGVFAKKPQGATGSIYKLSAEGASINDMASPVYIANETAVPHIEMTYSANSEHKVIAWHFDIDNSIKQPGNSDATDPRAAVLLAQANYTHSADNRTIGFDCVPSIKYNGVTIGALNADTVFSPVLDVLPSELTFHAATENGPASVELGADMPADRIDVSCFYTNVATNEVSEEYPTEAGTYQISVILKAKGLSDELKNNIYKNRVEWNGAYHQLSYANESTGNTLTSLTSENWRFQINTNTVTLTVDENGAPVIPEGATGVHYENNTLTIDEHTTARFAQGSTVKCDIVNNGTLDGGLFTGTVTGSGSIARGLFLNKPDTTLPIITMSAPESVALNGIVKPDATGLTTLYAINTLGGESDTLLITGEYIGTDSHTFHGWNLVQSLNGEVRSGVDHRNETRFEQSVYTIPAGMNGMSNTFLPVLEMDASDLTITADKTESKITGAVIESVKYVDESNPDAESTVYPTKAGSYKAIVTLTCPGDTKDRVIRTGNLCYHVPKTLEVPFEVKSEPVQPELPTVPPTDGYGNVTIEGTDEVKGDGWTAKKDDEGKTTVTITDSTNLNNTTLNCNKITINSNTPVSNLTTNAEVTVASGSTIDGGTFSGKVTSDGEIKGGTFEKDVTTTGTITDGTFNGNVFGTGTIAGGTFNGDINDNVTINGGTFTGFIDDHVIITGGTFTGDVRSINVTGGVFAGVTTPDVVKAKVTATGGASINNIQKNEGTNQETTVRVVGEQQLSLAYTPDTGRTFYGWQKDADIIVKGKNTNNTNVTVNSTDPASVYTPVVKLIKDDLDNFNLAEVAGTEGYYRVVDGELTGDCLGNERPTEPGDYALGVKLMTAEPMENTIALALYADDTASVGNIVLMKDGVGYYVPEVLAIGSTETVYDPDAATGSGDSGAGGAAVAVIGGAAIGGAAYLIGTQVYLTSVLPEGASIPTNRQQLADLLWTAAGKPQPASTALFTDISADAADSQKAARWCVEQGLLKDTGSTFKPDKHTFRPQVIKAWNDLQAKLNPQK